MLEYYNDADKESVYENYVKIVSKPKNINGVSIPQMITEVLKQFNSKRFLYNLCCSKELTFLKNILNNEIDEDDFLDYMFEIKTLSKKFIFDQDNFCIFPEQIDNVKYAIKKFNKYGAKSDEYIYPISILRIVGFLPLEMFKSANYENTKYERKLTFEEYLSNPLLKFYTTIYEENDEKYICYANYYELIPEIEEERKNYINFKSLTSNKYLIEEMFYYGFPIYNKKVKKMYEFINQNIPYIIDYVDEARVLNDYSTVERFLKDDKARKIINEGLEYSPSCALYGLSPIDYLDLKDSE